MRIHCCLFNKVCRNEDAPMRLYITVGSWHFYVGWMEVSLHHDHD